MHILYLMPASGFGGAERQGALHIRWLRLLGHRVTAVVGRSGPMVCLLNQAREDTIWLDDFPPAAPTKSTAIGNVAHAVRCARSVSDVACHLERVVEERSVDVVLANRTFAWLIAGQLRRRTGCPFVMRAGSRPRKEWLAQWLKLFAMFDAEPMLLVSNCRAVEEPYRPYLSVPKMILPNAVDPEMFQPRNAIDACQSLGLDHERHRVALAIRPSADKGLALLNEIARRTRMIQPKVEFVIAGEYPERAHYMKVVVEQGLADVIRFIGHIDDVAALYAASDLVLLTSPKKSIEGSPNALLEAMACGKPVVATAVGGIPELVQDGLDGFLISEHEPSSAASCIDLLIRDNSMRECMGVAGRKRAKTEHAPDAIARRLVAGIASCMLARAKLGGHFNAC